MAFLQVNGECCGGVTAGSIAGCDTWCCGCGGCNIFCCNCANGCNGAWWANTGYFKKDINEDHANTYEKVLKNPANVNPKEDEDNTNIDYEHWYGLGNSKFGEYGTGGHEIALDYKIECEYGAHCYWLEDYDLSDKLWFQHNYKSNLGFNCRELGKCKGSHLQI